MTDNNLCNLHTELIALQQTMRQQNQQLEQLIAEVRQSTAKMEGANNE